MDNDYNITNIERHNHDFKQYLFAQLDREARSFLEQITLDSDVYIFSGIIRDYFLNRNSIRDLDIVIDCLSNELESFLSNDSIRSYPIKKNRFGGYKININDLSIDLWSIDNTWGIIREEKSATKKSLIRSAFFNFSAILYSLKEEKFYYDEIFQNFLDKHIIDIVYLENPQKALCIVNTLYYKDSLNFPVSSNLKIWVKENFNEEYDLMKIQLERFGKVLYFQKDIIEFLIYCALDTSEKKCNK